MKKRLQFCLKTALAMMLASGGLTGCKLLGGGSTKTAAAPASRGQTGLVDPDYYVKAYKPNNPANVRVKVSLKNQAIYVMEGSRPLMVAACTVGTAATPTPRGNFRIYSKQKYRRKFTNPGKGYPMGYWCEFKPAYGIHAGWVHNAPRSHGCIRLHFKAAPKFFNLVREGTPVSISHTQAEDATIGANVLRPRDSNWKEFPPHILGTTEVFNVYKGPLFDG